MRFYDPSSGRVLYGDDNIRDYTPESWRNRIAIVPQQPALFTATIAENIAYGRPNATRADIENAARLANCSFIEALPRGFDTQVGARGAQLSGPLSSPSAIHVTRDLQFLVAIQVDSNSDWPLRGPCSKSPAFSFATSASFALAVLIPENCED